MQWLLSFRDIVCNISIVELYATAYVFGKEKVHSYLIKTLTGKKEHAANRSISWLCCRTNVAFSHKSQPLFPACFTITVAWIHGCLFYNHKCRKKSSTFSWKLGRFRYEHQDIHGEAILWGSSIMKQYKATCQIIVLYKYITNISYTDKQN